MTTPTTHEPPVSIEAMASELRISTSEVLKRADGVIDEIFRRGGLGAIAGVSVTSVGSGKLGVTASLARALRMKAIGS